jgi:hypothetical protein
VWRPIPPSEDYVAMGDVAVPDMKTEPGLESVVCVHKHFVKLTSPYLIPECGGYLWTSKGATVNQTCWSIWLTEPTLDSILCNTFHTVNGEVPIPGMNTYCLKLSSFAT